MHNISVKGTQTIYGVLKENGMLIYLGHGISNYIFRCNLKYGYVVLQSTKPSISDAYLWQRPKNERDVAAKPMYIYVFFSLF